MASNDSNDARLRAVILKIGIRERRTAVPPAKGAVAMLDQAVASGHRHRLVQHRVHQGEDHCVQADAQRERRDNRRRKPPVCQGFRAQRSEYPAQPSPATNPAAAVRNFRALPPRRRTRSAPVGAPRRPAALRQPSPQSTAPGETAVPRQTRSASCGTARNRMRVSSSRIIAAPPQCGRAQARLRSTTGPTSAVRFPVVFGLPLSADRTWLCGCSPSFPTRP